MNDSSNELDTYSDEETARRRDEALRRALNTPPQPKPTRKAKLEKDEKGAEKRKGS
jgi:hypothetical protein